MEGVGRKSDRQSVRQSSSARATHAHTRTHTRTHTDTRAPTHTDTRAHTLQVRITEEFFRQGDLERALAMPVTPVRACRPVNPLRNSARKISLQMARGIRTPTRCDILPPEAVVSGYLLDSGTHSPEDSRRILTGGGFRPQICDRLAASRVGLQRGFCAFIAPLHAGLAGLLAPLAPLASRLAATRAAWEACGPEADAELDREASALPGP